MADEQCKQPVEPSAARIQLPPPDQCRDHCDCDVAEGQEHMQADPPPAKPRDPRERKEP